MSAIEARARTLCDPPRHHTSKYFSGQRNDNLARRFWDSNRQRPMRAAPQRRQENFLLLTEPLRRRRRYDRARCFLSSQIERGMCAVCHTLFFSVNQMLQVSGSPTRPARPTHSTLLSSQCGRSQLRVPERSNYRI